VSRAICGLSVSIARCGFILPFRSAIKCMTLLHPPVNLLIYGFTLARVMTQLSQRPALPLQNQAQ
jgi:hypothetical protein